MTYQMIYFNLSQLIVRDAGLYLVALVIIAIWLMPTRCPLYLLRFTQPLDACPVGILLGNNNTPT